VAKEGQEIAVIEVKTRTGKNQKHAESCISRSKQRKITLSTQIFLSENKEFSDTSVRFDVLIINYNKYDETYKIKHIINAFNPFQAGE
jgi:putative endonuclease